jgi:hypothetical protein
MNRPENIVILIGMILAAIVIIYGASSFGRFGGMGTVAATGQWNSQPDSVVQQLPPRTALITVDSNRAADIGAQHSPIPLEPVAVAVVNKLDSDQNPE